LLVWREALLCNIASNETFYLSFSLLVYIVCEDKKFNVHLNTLLIEKENERKKERVEYKKFI